MLKQALIALILVSTPLALLSESKKTCVTCKTLRLKRRQEALKRTTPPQTSKKTKNKSKDKVLSVDKIDAKHQDSIMVLNDLALRPCKKILTNEIDPVIKAVYEDNDDDDDKTQDTDPDYTFVPCNEGVIRLNGNAAVNPSKKLFVNEISPVEPFTVLCPDSKEYITAYGENKEGSITLNGTVSVQSGRTWGQTDTIALTANTTTPVLKIYFSHTSNESTSSDISTGVHVTLHFLGTATDTTTYFDLFTTLESFVGPGSFTPMTLKKPTFYSGNNPQMTETITLEPKYTAGSDDNGDYVLINFIVSAEANELTSCTGTAYYEIIGSNVKYVARP